MVATVVGVGTSVVVTSVGAGVAVGATAAIVGTGKAIYSGLDVEGVGIVNSVKRFCEFEGIADSDCRPEFIGGTHQ